jgi:hypothetical protein
LWTHFDNFAATTIEAVNVSIITVPRWRLDHSSNIARLRNRTKK